MEETVRCKNYYQSLMENPSSDMFYRLIRQSKSRKESTTTCIMANNQKHFDINDQRRCFAQYYEDLATPKDNNYDNIYHKLCNIRCDNIEDKCLNSGESLLFHEEDVENAINHLNSGKAADEYGLSSEHLKAGKAELIPTITNIFNQILKGKKNPRCVQDWLYYPCVKERERLKIA